MARVSGKCTLQVSGVTGGRRSTWNPFGILWPYGWVAGKRGPAPARPEAPATPGPEVVTPAAPCFAEGRVLDSLMQSHSMQNCPNRRQGRANLVALRARDAALITMDTRGLRKTGSPVRPVPVPASLSRLSISNYRSSARLGLFSLHVLGFVGVEEAELDAGQCSEAPILSFSFRTRGWPCRVSGPGTKAGSSSGVLTAVLPRYGGSEVIARYLPSESAAFWNVRLRIANLFGLFSRSPGLLFIVSYFYEAKERHVPNSYQNRPRPRFSTMCGCRLQPVRFLRVASFPTSVGDLAILLATLV